MEDQLLDKLERDDTFCQFLKDDFDVKAYASQSLQAAVVSDLLIKLSAGIGTLDRELHQQVSTHHDDLLSQATGIETLESVLEMMHVRVQTLMSAVERLRTRLLEPFNKTAHHTIMLRNLQETCDMLRAIVRVMYLTKRLRVQVSGGAREITKAAQSLSELDHLMKSIDLSDVEVIEKDQMLIRQERKNVEYQAEQMLISGMEMQKQSHVATALQVFYNLGLLLPTIEKCIQTNEDMLRKSAHDAFNMTALSQQHALGLGGPRGKSAPGRAALPSIGSTPEFRATLWNNMEKLADQIQRTCQHVMHLQLVLAKKKDPVTHMCFMDELEKLGGGLILKRFWENVSGILKTEFSKTANESTHIRQAFEGQFPKLLYIFRDLWQRLQNFGAPSSASDEYDKKRVTFEVEAVLRGTLVDFESAYLSQSLSRLFDPVNIMFASTDNTLPLTKDVDIIARNISSELNAAAIDAELHRTVAKNVVKMIKLFAVKCEQMVCTNGEASQVIGPPTTGQTRNAHLINLLAYFKQQVSQVINNLGSSASFEMVQIIHPSLDGISLLMHSAAGPFLKSITEAVEAIILTIHNEDYSMSVQGEGDHVSCSLYMKELKDFLTRVKSQYLSLFECPHFVTTSIPPVMLRTVDFMIRHISLVRPLGGGGKKKLAADLTEVEKVLTNLCSVNNDLGRAFRALRSFRSLLFQTPEHISQSPSVGEAIPYSIAIHVLFSKVPSNEGLRSPHQVTGWSISRYSQWLDEHPQENARLTFLQGTLDAYARDVKQQKRKEYATVYPIMVQLLKKGLHQTSSINKGH